MFCFTSVSEDVSSSGTIRLTNESHCHETQISEFFSLRLRGAGYAQEVASSTSESFPTVLRKTHLTIIHTRQCSYRRLFAAEAVLNPRSPLHTLEKVEVFPLPLLVLSRALSVARLSPFTNTFIPRVTFVAVDP